MIDTRNLIIIEPTADYAMLKQENAIMKKNNGILVGCLTVLVVAITFAIYVDHKRQRDNN